MAQGRAYIEDGGGSLSGGEESPYLTSHYRPYSWNPDDSTSRHDLRLVRSFNDDDFKCSVVPSAEAITLDSILHLPCVSAIFQCLPSRSLCKSTAVSNKVRCVVWQAVNDSWKWLNGVWLLDTFNELANFPNPKFADDLVGTHARVRNYSRRLDGLKVELVRYSNRRELWKVRVLNTVDTFLRLQTTQLFKLDFVENDEGTVDVTGAKNDSLYYVTGVMDKFSGNNEQNNDGEKANESVTQTMLDFKISSSGVGLTAHRQERTRDLFDALREYGTGTAVPVPRDCSAHLIRSSFGLQTWIARSATVSLLTLTSMKICMDDGVCYTIRQPRQHLGASCSLWKDERIALGALKSCEKTYGMDASLPISLVSKRHLVWIRKDIPEVVNDPEIEFDREFDVEQMGRMQRAQMVVASNGFSYIR